MWLTYSDQATSIHSTSIITQSSIKKTRAFIQFLLAFSHTCSYFENHKNYWKSLPTPRVSNTQLARSKMMLKQLNNLADSSLKNLQAAFDAGKMSIALQIAQELLVLSGGFQDPTRYQISAYHYLSLIHVTLGRHDRAVCNASRLVRLSKSTDDIVQLCRSFVTLGKVHLSFGHLDAAARAWEHLSKELRAPIPVSWIRHEIGRCYLETGKPERAVEFAFKCVEAAVKGNSKKWMLNGRLLLGREFRIRNKTSNTIHCSTFPFCFP